MAFLSREVPAWFGQHRCFSCHNNGDGARALYRASQRGFALPDTALADTERWLAEPEKWDQDLANAEFKDARLARLQFAATLAVAAQQKDATERKDAALAKSLQQAAARLVQDQADDGSWPMNTTPVGGSTTYNIALATHLAREVLSADATAYHEPLVRSQKWFEQRKLANVVDAAAVLWAMAKMNTPAAQSQREAAIDLLRHGENSSGGWGPYVNSAAEPFDTALALLALAALEDKSLEPLITRGRAWLIEQQLDDGSWPATTRPPGGDSYAQTISTTAWCLQALLATQP